MCDKTTIKRFDKFYKNQKTLWKNCTTDDKMKKIEIFITVYYIVKLFFALVGKLSMFI